jgi:hypothetical protein
MEHEVSLPFSQKPAAACILNQINTAHASPIIFLEDTFQYNSPVYF